MALRRAADVLHVLPAVGRYADGLGAPDGVRAYGDRRPADWPAALYSPDGSAWLRAWV